MPKRLASIEGGPKQKYMLRCFAGLSDCKLIELLNLLKQRPELVDDDLVDRRTMERYDERQYEQHLACSAQLQMNKGPPWKLDLADPLLLMQFFAEATESYRTLLDLVAAKYPPGYIYHGIWYYDEATPGAVLRIDNKRKFWGVYFAFKEFGEALSREAAWVPVAVLRTGMCKKIAGGFSQAIGKVVDASKHSFTVGVTIVLPTMGATPFRADFTINFADEAALKTASDFKGASGVLPCMKCKNVMYNRALRAIAAGDYCVGLDCTDVSKFDCRTDEDVWDAVDHLIASRATMGVGEFEEEQKIYGLGFNEHGFFFNADREFVLPMTSLRFEPSHIWFAGVANEEIAKMMATLESLRPKITWKMVAEYFDGDFQWPSYVSNKGRSLSQCFNAVRRKATRKAGEFKAGLTETFMVVPLLNHFLETEVRPNAPAEIIDKLDSFNLLADVVHSYKLLKNTSTAMAVLPRFRRECEQHFPAFLKAYPGSTITWKRHATLHISDQVEADGMMYDALACERKHYEVKTACSNITKTATFERSALIKSIRMQQLNLSTSNPFINALVDESVTSDGHRVAKGVVFEYARFREKDFIIDGFGRGGVMKMATRVASAFAVVVEEWIMCDERRHRTTVWQPGGGGLVLWPLQGGRIHTPCFWYEHGDGLRIVVE